MVDDTTTDTLRRWRFHAIDGFTAAIESAPDATVAAYPPWTVRDLAIHVVRIHHNAALALGTSALERPRPELPVTRDDPPETLAGAVRGALLEAETALQRCREAAVWTPVGARGSSFWSRRLLREAVLHRWDAEQALGAPNIPDHEQALQLIDEFFDTDIARALSDADAQRFGVVAIRSGGRRWTVDLARGSVATGAEDAVAGATIDGEPAAVWLWLMCREPLPGPLSIDDADDGASAFSDLINRFNRPNR